MTEVDVLILGAGAAGLMCAMQAGRRGRRVLVLEHADRPGKKVLISGGGRCNFTNLHTSPENFLSSNPHFAKSALARFTPQDFIALVEQHRIPYHEKTLGQLFCDRSAHDILNLLLAECAAVNVRIQLSARILSVSSIGSAFRVETSHGPITTASLVVATGGLSIPKMGATSFGYNLARQFGHPIVPTRPGLVPLVFNPKDQAAWCDLTGLSTEVMASTPSDTLSARNAKPKTARSATFREKMLITHRGLSGPAILQISSYWQPGEPITIDLAPHQEVFAPLLRPNAPRFLSSAFDAARATLPARLAERWLAQNPSISGPILSNAEIANLEHRMHHWRIVPAATEGYAKAEVTAGGVDTGSLDARTMQSRINPGLYFIGEVVDVTGWLGGYNFQWAWASGFAAGQSA
jgi:predicted Rossmann fold flavoprotein